MQDTNDSQGDGAVALLTADEVVSGTESLDAVRCRQIHRHMVRARALEERMIKMSKSGEAYFWVGGPGEEAFNVCLGMQVRKGRGPAYDYLHLHYRSSAALLAMGMPMIDAVRQTAMTATDPHSMGRNFVAHYAVPDWNVVPVTSVIEVQYVMAPGTAWVQKRHGGQGVSVVTGGDAGTAEGDFASCMVWATRPGNELPVLMVVTNNGFGISTPAHTQHGERAIAERGLPFGIPGETVDGNDPVLSWHALERAFSYCRRTRRPFLLEAVVSRLYGHSSSSGAQKNAGEFDPIEAFEEKLLRSRVLVRETVERVWAEAREEADEAADRVRDEARPTAADVERFSYAPSGVDAIYPDDYTGLPGRSYPRGFGHPN